MLLGGGGGWWWSEQQRGGEGGGHRVQIHKKVQSGFQWDSLGFYPPYTNDLVVHATFFFIFFYNVL